MSAFPLGSIRILNPSCFFRISKSPFCTQAKRCKYCVRWTVRSLFKLGLLLSLFLFHSREKRAIEPVVAASSRGMYTRQLIHLEYANKRKDNGRTDPRGPRQVD